MGMRPSLPGVAFLLLSATVLAAPAPATAAVSITWHDYDTGLNLSLTNHTPSMLDFSTSWCNWCKKMDADTYSDVRVVNRSERFICIKIDGDARGDLVAQYRVTGYPTTVFLNPDGTEKHRVVGYKGPEDFLKDMAFALGEGHKPTGSKGPCAFAVAPGLVLIPAIILLRKKGT